MSYCSSSRSQGLHLGSGVERDGSRVGLGPWGGRRVVQCRRVIVVVLGGCAMHGHGYTDTRSLDPEKQLADSNGERGALAK
jgi:hypothetical protein